MDILGDRIYVIAVFPMLENKWEVTIAIQTVLTKNGSLDNAAKNILLAALEKSISLDTYNESADMGNTFSYLEETEPFLFSASLVKWALCGSKTAHALDGCSYPSGCVTTLQKFLKFCRAT